MMLLVSPHAKVRKLGPGVAATYREVGPSCPLSCKMLKKPDGSKGPCYALRGRAYMVQRWHLKKRDTFQKANGVGYIRHLVTGGWMKETKNGRRVVDRDHARAVFDWHRQHSQRFTRGWSYTHAPKQMQKAGFGPENQPDGLEILASCHSIEEAKDLQADGWRTARVADEMVKMKNEAYCPYDLNKRNGVSNEETGMNCMTCRLCFDNPVNIVFLKF